MADQEPSSESTPLLTGEPSSQAQATDAPPRNEQEPPPPASTHFPHQRKILSIIILSSSLITGILLLAAHILIVTSDFGETNWWTSHLLGQLGIFIVIALVFSSINLKWNFPVFLNILLDGFLVLYISGAAFQLLDFWPSKSWCMKRDYYGKNPPEDLGPVCHAKLLAVEILIGVAVAGAVVVALSHLVLFVLRCIALWRTKFWTRPMPFPTGSITLEVSLRIKGQDNREMGVEATS